MCNDQNEHNIDRYMYFDCCKNVHIQQILRNMTIVFNLTRTHGKSYTKVIIMIIYLCLVHNDSDIKKNKFKEKQDSIPT